MSADTKPRYLVMVGVNLNGERVCSAEVSATTPAAARAVMLSLVGKTDADAISLPEADTYDRGGVSLIEANPLPIAGFSIEKYDDLSGTDANWTMDFDANGRGVTV